jgi:hypothetical protein
MLQLRTFETILRQHATIAICPRAGPTRQGEATMRIVEMLASTVVAVGSLALVAGVLYL